MYALKRIAAYAIDMALVYMPLAALLGYGDAALIGRLSPHLRTFAAFGSWAVVMFLNVKDCAGDPPGFAQGILREIVKAVSLGFFFGMIYALQGLLTRGQTFYDAWLDLDVEDLKPYGLSETQKNWRKYHRELAKRNRG
jgi:hypothetical protein